MGRKFNAFTLAEVLITLAIIGIVAALTIPTLVGNYQKKQWVAGLQKGYATLNNVFRLAMADDGVDNITQTLLWMSITPDSNGRRNTIDTTKDYSEFISNLQKYLKINKFCNPTSSKNECFNIEYKALNGDDFTVDEAWMQQFARLKIYASDGIVYYLRFADGAQFSIKYFDNTRNLGIIEIDVNGDNPPNQVGRDLFSITVLDNGKFLIPGTKAWVDTEVDNNWEMTYWQDEENGFDCNPATSGYWTNYCAARIFENGWKMDY